MILYRSPVAPPMSQPFCFPFPPQINPPVNTLKKEIIVISKLTDFSSVCVNVNMSEKSRLEMTASVKIVSTPNKMDTLNFFTSMIHHSFLHLFGRENACPFLKDIQQPFI